MATDTKWISKRSRRCQYQIDNAKEKHKRQTVDKTQQSKLKW